jgi:GGDEF domain-containing protein
MLKQQDLFIRAFATKPLRCFSPQALRDLGKFVYPAFNHFKHFNDAFGHQAATRYCVRWVIF